MWGYVSRYTLIVKIDKNCYKLGLILATFLAQLQKILNFLDI